MSKSVIEINNISKRYRIGELVSYKTLRDEIMQTITAPFRRRPKKSDEDNILWALKDVSFELKQGEVLGVIGKNGAGKSTLLKILSRITEPTGGSIRLLGRVASLLEVGTGFHPELTGRENILLNGSLLGMTQRDIRSKLDEIVAFSGVEKFIDTPVKRYSSGMYVRLAFAVAAHLEPEILIIDEVLSVGDAEFQKKCLGKMSDVASEGRTVIFVSHNMGAVQSLCERAILLVDGKVAMDDAPTTVVNHYLSMGLSGQGERVWPEVAGAPGSDDIRMHAVRVLDKNGKVSDTFDVRDPVKLKVDYWVLRQQKCICVSFYFYNARGELIFISYENSMYTLSGDTVWDPGLYESTCYIPGDFLNNGQIFVKAALTGEKVVHANEREVVSFIVRDAMFPLGVRGNYRKEWPPAGVRPRFEWTTKNTY